MAKSLSGTFCNSCKFLLFVAISHSTWLLFPKVSGLQVRLCTLEPWSVVESSGKKHPVIGWTREERDIENQSYRVQIGLCLEDESNHLPSWENALSISLPFVADEISLGATLWPAGLATAILCRTPSIVSLASTKNILELGAGLGLPGRVLATEGPRSVVITDNDEAFLKYSENAELMQPPPSSSSPRILRGDRLEWRDAHDCHPLKNSFDIILGTDVAYYFFLLRPLMDTIQAFRHCSGFSLMIVGQANRKSQWDLYDNILHGCYNQMTDQHDGPWHGKVQMLLYKLKMHKWHDPSQQQSAAEDGVVPISAIVHEDGVSHLTDYGLTSMDYVATEQDRRKQEMTF